MPRAVWLALAQIMSGFQSECAGIAEINSAIGQISSATQARGASPNAGVMRDPAGNLYGTLQYGGTEGGGVVFKLAP
jgi:hypothetical protein